MGLGVGVDCEVCGSQLCYGSDTDSIFTHTVIDDDGEQIIKNRPVLCDNCHKIIDKYMELTCLR